ncbi:DUF2024 family protein [Xanthomarina sp. F2636L]|uniref:DUF2024 family protein n=1 Tax=Xanthomarina sp. F2636L TaxID=2996018 RepID=UPI00225E58BD|nr:DUF2024 family protein [Xanthomarina sp. F2636L]MCX7550416.1 DUF2024 family protein [Xanthomarina sp. F2636L]
MKVSVWDTYVQREDGNIMHFDILVPSSLSKEETIFNYGKTYLESKPFKTGKLTASECKFCHIEQATDSMIKAIEKVGFYIIEMEHCN